MKENKEINDKENIIQQERNMEEQNYANIDKTIRFMSYHIDGDKTKEYLDFIKKVRKLKKKINKKKEKLQEFEKLEKAYLEKDGGIRKLFENFAVNYKDRLNNYDTVTEQRNKQNETYSLYQMENLEYLAQAIDKANLYYNYIEEFHFDSYIAFTLKQERSETSPLDVRFMIQNHYNHINARLMADILEYYENELEYWKSCLKQIEIENIKEFE